MSANDSVQAETEAYFREVLNRIKSGNPDIAPPAPSSEVTQRIMLMTLNVLAKDNLELRADMDAVVAIIDAITNWRDVIEERLDNLELNRAG